MPNAKLGERAILAFDRGNQDIAIRRSDKYKAVISDFLQKKFEDISPFACLELSILAGNDKLALQSARECLVQMGGSHSQLAQNWLRGASIPDEIRSTLTETSSNSAFENTDRIWTVNFRGPKVIVRGLTQFCGEVMHRHRSTAIRQIFSPSNRDDLPHSEDMEAIVQAIYELGSSATQEHLFLMRTSESRGRVALPPGADPNWVNLHYTDFRQKYFDSKIRRDVARMGIDINSERTCVLIYIWATLHRKTKRAAPYIKELNFDDTHAFFELRNANAVAERLRNRKR
ncbi:hypothetical protein [Devosia sp.]|uniref:hypothetical protein n=1 Tax=Devosia sp. TaxID=1871048 RepID=UPI0025E4D425|nr:hypothetical protein [Devosia sp.]MCR6635720.1 hypothetical protein [Devosia sp.]